MDQSLIREHVVLGAVMSFTPLAAAAFLGLIANLAQAVTQIQEQTFSFIIKIAAVGAVLFLFGSGAFERTVSLIQISILAMR